MTKTVMSARVTDQHLTLVNVPLIASGGVDEIRIHFQFCNLWDECGKTAVFYRDPDEVYHVPIADGSVIVPHEVLTEEGFFYFGVMGTADNIRTTEVVRMYVAQGAITTATANHEELTPDIYQQILAAYGKLDTALAREAETREAEVAAERAAREAEVAAERAAREAAVAAERVARQTEIAVERARLDNFAAMSSEGGVKVYEATNGVLSVTITSNGVMAYVNAQINGACEDGDYVRCDIPEYLEPMGGYLVLERHDFGDFKISPSIPAIGRGPSVSFSAYKSFDKSSLGTVAAYPLASISIPEVIDGRIDHTGLGHETLGDAIRQNFGELYNGGAHLYVDSLDVNGGTGSLSAINREQLEESLSKLYDGTADLDVHSLKLTGGTDPRDAVNRKQLEEYLEGVLVPLVDTLYPAFEEEGKLVQCVPTSLFGMVVTAHRVEPEGEELPDLPVRLTVCGKNLYDRETYPLDTDGYPYSGTTAPGRFSTTADYKRTGFIPVAHLQGQTIVWSHCPNGSNPGMAFYTRIPDISDTEDCKAACCGSTTKASIQVPANAKYMVFSVKAADAKADVQIELGSVSTRYEAYRAVVHTEEFVGEDLYISSRDIPNFEPKRLATVYAQPFIGSDYNCDPIKIKVSGNTDSAAMVDLLTQKVNSLTTASVASAAPTAAPTAEVVEE